MKCRTSLGLFVSSVLLCAPSCSLSSSSARVSLISEPGLERVAEHGLTQLRAALQARGVEVEDADELESATGDAVVMAGLASGDGTAAGLLSRLGVAAPSEPESLLIRRVEGRQKPLLLVAGADERGLMYALLDVADRVGWASDPSEPLSEVREVGETPYTHDRSVSVYTMNRAYWESRFYDEAYWTRYFDMLAADRFNKFLIVFGYETGGFMAPCYPYFFDTPGFPDVRMRDLTPDQQKKNRAALNRLIELAHDRGIAVAVGIWDHIFRGGVQSGGIEWTREYGDGPLPNTVEGVTTENLNVYTLAALEEFFDVFPALDEVQFRIHEESGLKREEMDEFWREVFTMVKRERPDLLFEARGKGTPDSVIETALSLDVNLRMETKYWMEQMGLPFHPTHVNPPNQHDRRHGYADFLRYPKRYDMNWNLWNGGTTRVLLWGDPDYVRRFVKTTYLYDSPNWNVNEPLATKMEAQHPDMKPFDLMPAEYRYYDYEFERYWHFYQLWGRLGYNPDTPSEVWRHEFERRFGAEAAPHVEAALHRASRILPHIVAAVYPYRLFPTTRGWAERQSLGPELESYARNEATDVQQFESFVDAAKRIQSGGVTTRRTPQQTSEWFDKAADDVLAEVDQAEEAVGEERGNEFESTMTDLRILANLARFHARRAPAAIHFNLYKLSGDVREFDAAIAGERKAVAAWRAIVEAAGDRYTFNLAMGIDQKDLAGHWRDELSVLEADLANIEQQRSAIESSETESIMERRPAGGDDVTPPRVVGDRLGSAKPQEPLRITARVDDPSGLKSVRLRYRHVTQFEDYAVLEMRPTGEPGVFAATVPGNFLSPRWDFMYFIEALDMAGNGIQWPDLAKESPYIIVPLER